MPSVYARRPGPGERERQHTALGGSGVAWNAELRRAVPPPVRFIERVEERFERVRLEIHGSESPDDTERLGVRRRCGAHERRTGDEFVEQTRDAPRGTLGEPEHRLRCEVSSIGRSGQYDPDVALARDERRGVVEREVNAHRAAVVDDGHDTRDRDPPRSR